MLRFTFPFRVPTQGFIKLVSVGKLISVHANHIKMVSYNNHFQSFIKNKNNIRIKYGNGVELLNVGNVKENNWCDVYELLDKRDKMEMEHYLHMDDSQRRHFKLSGCEVILWNTDKHRLKYDNENDEFVLMRS